MLGEMSRIFLKLFWDDKCSKFLCIPSDLFLIWSLYLFISSLENRYLLKTYFMIGCIWSSNISISRRDGPLWKSYYFASNCVIWGSGAIYFRLLDFTGKKGTKVNIKSETFSNWNNCSQNKYSWYFEKIARTTSFWITYVK